MRILLKQFRGDVIPRLVAGIREAMPVWARGAVLGMSGGIDSAVVAALTAKAFRRTDWTLRAYALPSRFNPEQDSDDAKAVADLFSIRLDRIPIQSLLLVACETLDGRPATEQGVRTHAALDGMRFPTDCPVAAGNLTSRLRATLLWTLAEIQRCIVMGTGNQDEDYGVGYYTLTGDGLVHLNPIGKLPKRLVRELGRALGLPASIVNRTPTAGLEEHQTDATDLGYSYEFVELVVAGTDQGIGPGDLSACPQVVEEWTRCRTFTRHADIDAAVLDVLQRHHVAQAKSKLVCPEVIRCYCPVG